MSRPLAPAAGGNAGTVGSWVGNQGPHQVGWSGPDGWYLLKYLNGDVAVVFLKNHIFQFGTHTPTGTRTATPYLIGNSASINSGQVHVAQFLTAHGIPANQQAAIITAIDNQITRYVTITKGGKVTSPTRPGGDATSTSILNPNPSGHLSVPNPLDALGGLLSSWGELLVRVLEGLVGVGLLFLGLQALTGTGGQGQPIRTVKKLL